jgi:hypothetical protein
MVRTLLLLTLTSCVSYPEMGRCLSSNGLCELCEEDRCLLAN